MSLERRKFNACIGDLVVFSNPNDVSLAGFVRGYTGEKVLLSNRGYDIPKNDMERGTSFWNQYPFSEKRYSTNLSLWEDYKILDSANNKKG